MCEAYAAAGYDPNKFWSLSPRLYVSHMRAAKERHVNEHQARAWAVWHTEALARVRRLPDFSKFGTIRKPQRQTPQQIEAMGMALAAAWGAKKA